MHVLCIIYVYFMSIFGLIFPSSFFVQRYGSALNFDSATYERLHQEVVVQPVAADARREEGMLKRLYYRVNATTLVKCHLATLEEVTGTSQDIREQTRELHRPRKDTPFLYQELRKMAEAMVEDHRRVSRVLAAMTYAIQDELSSTFYVPPDISTCYVWDHFVLDFGAEKVRFVCEAPGPNSRYYTLHNLCLFDIYFMSI